MKGISILYTIITLGCLGNLLYAVHERHVSSVFGWFSAFMLSLVTLMLLYFHNNDKNLT
jgi:hypothetical protein